MTLTSANEFDFEPEPPAKKPCNIPDTVEIENPCKQPKVDDDCCQEAEVVICSDISHGLEPLPISYSDVPGSSTDFLNVFTYLRSGFVVVCDQPPTSLAPKLVCACSGSCLTENCTCSRYHVDAKPAYYKNGCLTSTYYNETDNDAFDDTFECGTGCACSTASCGNRVVQTGLRYRLQVFRTPNRGYGLRTLEPIPRGAFVIEYTGELMTDDQSNERHDDTYMYEAPTQGFTVDAKLFGSASRFINQSCEPNVRSKRVSWDGKARIGVFVHRHDIAAGDELTMDYGDFYWSQKGGVHDTHTLYCLCGFPTCRYSEAKWPEFMRKMEREAAERSELEEEDDDEDDEDQESSVDENALLGDPESGDDVSVDSNLSDLIDRLLDDID